jgi:hypothetical protein
MIPATDYGIFSPDPTFRSVTAPAWAMRRAGIHVPTEIEGDRLVTATWPGPELTFGELTKWVSATGEWRE